MVCNQASCCRIQCHCLSWSQTPRLNNLISLNFVPPYIHALESKCLSWRLQSNLFGVLTFLWSITSICHCYIHNSRWDLTVLVACVIKMLNLNAKRFLHFLQTSGVIQIQDLCSTVEWNSSGAGNSESPGTILLCSCITRELHTATTLNLWLKMETEIKIIFSLHTEDYKAPLGQNPILVFSMCSSFVDFLWMHTFSNCHPSLNCKENMENKVCLITDIRIQLLNDCFQCLLHDPKIHVI